MDLFGYPTRETDDLPKGDMTMGDLSAYKGSIGISVDVGFRDDGTVYRATITLDDKEPVITHLTRDQYTELLSFSIAVEKGVLEPGNQEAFVFLLAWIHSLAEEKQEPVGIFTVSQEGG